MTDSSQLRVSDADRERVAEELRGHYAAGRITSDELDDRLEAVYAARTEAELSALGRDLPVMPPAVVRLARDGWRLLGPAADLEPEPRRGRRHHRDRGRRHPSDRW